MGIRLGSVPVFVSDQERALEFYRDRLGLEVVLDIPYGPEFRWLALAERKGATEVILFRPARSVVGDQQAEVEKRIGVWTGIVFLTDDIERDYERLRERGVEFLTRPAAQPWGGWEAQFSDPDGNRYHLAQRPDAM
jgi:catechol 2,3-dioxygenase-like lactoylglutathione lyase family enzyme